MPRKWGYCFEKSYCLESLKINREGDDLRNIKKFLSWFLIEMLKKWGSFWKRSTFYNMESILK